MRFKPKSDIERVLESINNYSFGRINQKIFKNINNNSLKDLFSKTSEKKFSLKNLEININKEKDDSFFETKSNDNFKKNLVRSSNISKKNNKNINLSDSKSFIKKLQYKTHFKAAIDFTNFNSK